MKVNKLLKVLHKETQIAFIDKFLLDIVCKVKETPENLKMRNIKQISRASSDLPYDFLIQLKI